MYIPIMYMYLLNPTISRISLILHNPDAKLRWSVTFRIPYECRWGLTGFCPTKF